MKITIDDSDYVAEAGEHLIEVLNRAAKKLPRVCYHPQLGPIQTCDTCLLEINGVHGTVNRPRRWGFFELSDTVAIAARSKISNEPAWS